MTTPQRKRLNRGDDAPEAIKDWLRRLSRAPLLTHEQEIELSAIVRANPGSTESLKARNLMVESNMRLVVSIAKKYRDYGDIADRVSAGTVGLVRAAEMFDGGKGFKFSTYAHWWIRQAIMRGFQTEGTSIRLPAHRHEEINKISRIKEKLQSNGVEPSIAAISAASGMPIEKVEGIQGSLGVFPRRVASLNTTVGRDREDELGDLLPGSNEPSWTELTNLDTREAVAKLLSVLTINEKKVVIALAGLGGKEPVSLARAGESLGVSRERARQIHVKAMKKLRVEAAKRPELRVLLEDVQ